MNPRHIPPLPSLRAFEASARLGSFTAAAQELNVTQSAVSQAVRQLEEHLGRELFKRHAATIQLTPEARQFATNLGRILEELLEATNALSLETTPVTVACARSILHHWFLPGLREFRILHPTIMLQIIGTGRGEAGSSVDFSLVSASPAAPPPDSELLWIDRLVLVASPELAEQVRNNGNKLEGIPKIGTFGSDWSRWQSDGLFAEASNSGLILRLREATAIIHAALEGLGVALVSEFLAAEEIRSGRLVLLSERRLPRDHAIWLQSRIKTPSDNAFRLIEWLKARVNTSQHDDA
ncbi:LysR family transcriptional regulator [Ochrobactrum sp. CDB2]|nr:LysR family transcriptional regulator [Ochrobactrum sp. CDB2]